MNWLSRKIAEHKAKRRVKEFHALNSKAEEFLAIEYNKGLFRRMILDFPHVDRLEYVTGYSGWIEITMNDGYAIRESECSPESYHKVAIEIVERLYPELTCTECVADEREK